MLVGLHVATNFEIYRQNSEKALLGGGGGIAPLPSPATLMAGNAKEANTSIWFGRESAREARGKFKDLVCLVVFLCWIKRFVLLSLCLKCKYMNKYFSSFQKSRGGGDDPPRKIRGGGGDTSPPPPPGSPPMAHTIWPADHGLTHVYKATAANVHGRRCGRRRLGVMPTSARARVTATARSLAKWAQAGASVKVQNRELTVKRTLYSEKDMDSFIDGSIYDKKYPNPKKIATKGFSTVFCSIRCPE